MKLTIQKIQNLAAHFGIALERKNYIESMYYSPKSNDYLLRLFNTNETLASVPSLFNKDNTKPLDTNLEYVKSGSTNSLLFMKRAVLGTKKFNNVRYYYLDTDKRNRKTELILTKYDYLMLEKLV